MGVNTTVGVQPPKQTHGSGSKTNLQVNIKNTTHTCMHTRTEQRESGFDMNGFFRTCKLLEENHLEICSVNSNSYFIGKINVRRLSAIIDSAI